MAGYHAVMLTLAQRQLDISLWKYLRKGRGLGWAVWLKGSGLYLPKRGCDEITSSFVAKRINLLPLISLTHVVGGMATVGLESVSSFDHQPLLYWSTRDSMSIQP